MASPDGKVVFEAAGASHALQFTTNRLCLLEEKTGATLLQVATELALGKSEPLGVSVTTIRALFWAGTGDGKMTTEQAGDLVQATGHARAVRLAIEAFDAAFPDAEEGGSKDGDDRPPVAAAG